MANEHNTVTWTAHTLAASDGKDYYIASGTTTDDISGRLVAGTLYYIYWDQASPYKYSTIIASSWGDTTPAGKHVISEVTGQASTAHHGTVNANVEYKTDVPATSNFNMSAVGQQDSITSATVSNMGSTATTGHRLKINTPGATAPASAGGSTDANRHWIRGYTADSLSDVSGRWLDIDGYDKSISIRSGQATDRLLGKFDGAGISFYDRSANGYILSGINETGLKFYNGTATSGSDATTIAHYAGSGIKFYNNSGLADANVLMYVHPAGGINFYDGTNGYLTMRMGYSNYMDLYDGTQATADGDRLAGIFGATISGTGATNTGSGLRFFNASGQGSSDANKTIEIVGNGNANENGLYVLGNTTSAIGTGGDSLIKFERGTAYIGSSQSGSYDANKYGYLGVRTISSVDYLTLSSGATTNVLLNSPAGSAVKITSDTVTSGLEMTQVLDTTNDKVFCNLYPISVMNGSHATLGTRQAAPWINIGYYPSSSSGWNSRPINAIGSYFFNAAYDGTNAAPNYTWDGDTDTGIYRAGADNIGVTTGGSTRLQIKNDGTYLIRATVANAIEVNRNASSGLLTIVSSSRRYKDNIADLDINTENIYGLRPVSFDWKSNGESDFGFIAEEVHEILPELVVYNGDNTPEAVKYKQLSILMLEELKKLREEVKDLKEKV